MLHSNRIICTGVQNLLIHVPSGLPLLPCATYAVFRALLDDTLCWALPAEVDGWIEWIYMIPGKLLMDFGVFVSCLYPWGD